MKSSSVAYPARLGSEVISIQNGGGRSNLYAGGSMLTSVRRVGVRDEVRRVGVRDNCYLG